MSSQENSLESPPTRVAHEPDRAPPPAPETAPRKGPPPLERHLPWLGLGLFVATLLLLALCFPAPMATRLQRHFVRSGHILLALLSSWLLTQGVRTVLELWHERGTGVVQDEERAARLLIRDRAGLFLGLFVLFATPLLLWFVGEWPGHFTSDERSTLAASRELRADPWLSTLWGLFAGAVHRLSGNYTTLSVINILLLSWVLADIFSLMLQHGLSRRVAAVFVLLLVTSIPVGTLSIFLSHDILTGFLKLSIIAVLLRMLVRGALLRGRPGSTTGSLVLLSVLVVATSLLRGENIALYLYIPALLLLTRQARPLVIGAMVLGLLGGNLFFRKGVEPWVNDPWYLGEEVKNRYALTLMFNPIGFMLTNDYFTPTREEDRRVISELVEWECINGRPDVYEPDCYWYHLRGPVTPERTQALKRVYISSILNNPALFLANRVIVFFGHLGINIKPRFHLHFDREQQTDQEIYKGRADIMEVEGLLFERENASTLSRWTRKLRDWSAPRGGFTSAGYWIWNGVPAFALLLWLAATWRKNPISAALAGVILVPLGLVFAAAPASHINYVTDLWVFGYLAIPLLVFERKALKARVAAGSPTP